MALWVVAAVLAMVAAHLPVAGFVALFAWGAPVTILWAEDGPAPAALAVVLSLVLLLATRSPGVVVGLVIAEAVAALTLGFVVRRRVPPPEGYLVSLAGGIVAGLLVLLAVRLASGSNVVAILAARSQAAGSRTAGDIGRFLFPGGRAALASALGLLPQFLSLLFPATLLMVVTGVVATNYALALGWLRRHGSDYPSFPAFATWRLPVVALAVYLVPTLVLLVGSTWQVPVAAGLWSNLLALVYVAFATEGVAVVYHALSRWRWLPRVAKVAVVAYMFLLPYVADLVVLLGATDVAINYRGLSRPTWVGRGRRPDHDAQGGGAGPAGPQP